MLICFGFKRPCSIHLTQTVFWQMLSIDCGLGTWWFSIFTANRSFLLYMYSCCSFGLVSARLVDFPSKSLSLQALPINACLIHQRQKPRPPSEKWRAKEKSQLIMQLPATFTISYWSTLLLCGLGFHHCMFAFYVSFKTSYSQKVCVYLQHQVDAKVSLPITVLLRHTSPSDLKSVLPQKYLTFLNWL